MKKSTITFATEQGPRNHQEDRGIYSIFNNSDFSACLMAVFDGHGGEAVAEYCAGEIKNKFHWSSIGKTEEILKNLVSRLNADTRHFEEGSTLSLALIVERSYHLPIVSVAVLGDSPVIVYDRAGKTHVSPEHNIRINPRELGAAIERGAIEVGGYIHEKGGALGLQLSRALGDCNLDSILSREPDVYTIIDPRWILVATDGLLDPHHLGVEGDLVQSIRKFAEISATAEELMKWAEIRGLKDNATTMVWQAHDFRY